MIETDHLEVTLHGDPSAATWIMAMATGSPVTERPGESSKLFHLTTSWNGCGRPQLVNALLSLKGVSEVTTWTTVDHSLDLYTALSELGYRVLSVTASSPKAARAMFNQTLESGGYSSRLALASWVAGGRRMLKNGRPLRPNTDDAVDNHF